MESQPDIVNTNLLKESMERIQPYFKLNLKKKVLEVWHGSAISFYGLLDEDIPIVEKLLQRDFKTAILFRRHSNEAISEMALDILERRG